MTDIKEQENAEKKFDPWEWLSQIEKKWPGPDNEKKSIDFDELEKRFK